MNGALLATHRSSENKTLREQLESLTQTIESTGKRIGGFEPPTSSLEG